ncbi:MAG: V-type ATP synthase subunit E [Candidatus Pacebacteria bacterium]|nr:V-type ATP synthase subunit E [Candidatus Paceibacterota bacterium]
MSHNTLLERIRTDAAAEVEKIQQAGQAELAAVVSETERQLGVKRAAHHAVLKKELAQRELVAISKAKQEAKIAVQRAKREEVDALFAAVAESITQRPTAEYVAFFTKYAATIVPKSVIVKSVQAPAARLSETDEVLKKIGLSVTSVANDKLKAGFIIEATDGVYDVTLERLLAEKRAELEMEVIKKVLV